MTLTILAGALVGAFIMGALPAGFKAIGKREGLHEIQCADGTVVKLTDSQVAHLKEHKELPEHAAPAKAAPTTSFDQQQYSRALAMVNDRVDHLEAFKKKALEAMEAMAARLVALETAKAPTAEVKTEEAPVAVSKEDRTKELDELTVADLKKLATERSIAFEARATKAELVETILKAEYPATEGDGA